MTVPDTPKERSILTRIERRMMGHPEPSEDEIVKEIEICSQPWTPAKS